MYSLVYATVIIDVKATKLTEAIQEANGRLNEVSGSRRWGPPYIIQIYYIDKDGDKRIVWDFWNGKIGVCP